MLKYMPLYGSILLTVIIVWIIVYAVRSNRRKIADALHRRHFVGDRKPAANDLIVELSVHDELSAAAREFERSIHRGIAKGFHYESNPGDPNEFSRRSPGSPPDAARGPGVEGQFGVRPTGIVLRQSGGQIADVLSEVTSGCALCGGELEHTDDCPRGIVLDMMPDQDECLRQGDLTMPPMPNIGGEGHPEYKGPHYNVPHDRFVPYDVLRDPPEGAAVHIVGNVACVGPLEVESGDRGHADTVREEDES